MFLRSPFCSEHDGRWVEFLRRDLGERRIVHVSRSNVGTAARLVEAEGHRGAVAADQVVQVDSPSARSRVQALCIARVVAPAARSIIVNPSSIIDPGVQIYKSKSKYVGSDQ